MVTYTTLLEISCRGSYNITYILKTLKLTNSIGIEKRGKEIKFLTMAAFSGGVSALHFEDIPRPKHRLDLFIRTTRKQLF